MDFEKILTPTEADALGIPRASFVISTPTAKQAESLRAARATETPIQPELPLRTRKAAREPARQILDRKYPPKK